MSNLGKFLCVGLCVFFAGCVSLPKQQAYDRSGHESIKTIRVLAVRPVNFQVLLLNDPAASFGLIGGLISAGEKSSKEDKLKAIYADTPFDPMEYFKGELSKDMAARGYKLEWPANLENSVVKRDSSGFREAYLPQAGVDAVLDVNLGFYGFAAGGVGKDSPYRPTASMDAKLLSADGKQVYFLDYFVYNNVFNAKNAVSIEPDPRFSYPKFGDLKNAGVNSEAGLKIALAGLAKSLSDEL